MKGRGLLVAAGVIQLIGCALGLVGGLMIALLSLDWVSTPDSNEGLAMVQMAVVLLIASALMLWVSIKLIQRRRWAWIVSFLACSLVGAGLLLGIAVVIGVGAAGAHTAFGVGFSTLIIVFIVGSPVLVVIGLLIAGRGATLGAPAPGVSNAVT
jgi:hypothetical protein